MIIYIGEGKNDAIFISSVLEKHFNIKNKDLKDCKSIIIDDNKNIEKKKTWEYGINKIVNYLTKEYSFNLIKNTYGLLIYGDTGRDTVIKYILPKMLDIIGNTPEPENIKILCILDEDGIELSTTIQKIVSMLENRANNRSDKFIIKNNGNYITLKIEDDHRYLIEIYIFQIPDSLEINIVRKGIKVFNIKGKQEEKLLNNDPHVSLEMIAKLNNISKEQLIKKSVFDGWFNKDRWYQDLIKKIEKIS